MTKHAAYWIATVALVGGMATSGWAQQSQQSKGDEPEASSMNPDRLVEDSDELLDDTKVQSMSGSEKLNQAQSKIKKSKNLLSDTRALRKKAQSKEKDVIKINCINDKLAAIKGFLKIAEQRYVRLKKAVQSKDTKASNLHYTLIAVSEQKIDKLQKEAKLCVGDVQRYAEGTSVDIDVQDDIAADPEYLPQEPTQTGTLPELTPAQ